MAPLLASASIGWRDVSLLIKSGLGFRAPVTNQASRLWCRIERCIESHLLPVTRSCQICLMNGENRVGSSVQCHPPNDKVVGNACNKPLTSSRGPAHFITDHRPLVVAPHLGGDVHAQALCWGFPASICCNVAQKVMQTTPTILL